jgi:hypothetical protein
MPRRRLTRAQKRLKRVEKNPQPKVVKLQLQQVLSEMEKSAKQMHIHGQIHEVKIEAAKGARFARCHENVQKFCFENPGYKHICCWNVLEEKDPKLTNGNGYPFWAQFHSIAQAPDGSYLDVTPTSADHQIYAEEHSRQIRHVGIEESITGPDYTKAILILQKASGLVITVNHRFVDFETRFGEEWSPDGGILLVGLKMVHQVVTGKFSKKDPQIAVLRAARKMFIK